MTTEEETYYIRYDCNLRKVGCVLLQVLGGTVPKALFFKYFGDTKSWLLHPTPDLFLYPIKESQLKALASKTDFGEKKIARLPCGCHCEGGCGDPYAACMWPCKEHIPY